MRRPEYSGFVTQAKNGLGNHLGILFREEVPAVRELFGLNPWSFLADARRRNPTVTTSGEKAHPGGESFCLGTHTSGIPGGLELEDTLHAHGVAQEFGVTGFDAPRDTRSRASEETRYEGEATDQSSTEPRRTLAARHPGGHRFENRREVGTPWPQCWIYSQNPSGLNPPEMGRSNRKDCTHGVTRNQGGLYALGAEQGPQGPSQIIRPAEARWELAGTTVTRKVRDHKRENGPQADRNFLPGMAGRSASVKQQQGRTGSKASEVPMNPARFSGPVCLREGLEGALAVRVGRRHHSALPGTGIRIKSGCPAPSETRTRWRDWLSGAFPRREVSARSTFVT